jgi:hypothetical protein
MLKHDRPRGSRYPVDPQLGRTVSQTEVDQSPMLRSLRRAGQVRAGERFPVGESQDKVPGSRLRWS